MIITYAFHVNLLTMWFDDDMCVWWCDVLWCDAMWCDVCGVVFFKRLISLTRSCRSFCHFLTYLILLHMIECVFEFKHIVDLKVSSNSNLLSTSISLSSSPYLFPENRYYYCSKYKFLSIQRYTILLLPVCCCNMYRIKESRWEEQHRLLK